MDEITYQNTGQVIDPEGEPSKFHEPTELEKKLTAFVVDHTDRWRDYRDQNYLKDWEKYERIFRGQWKEDDKTRNSERSRIISPATQQAVETRHAEMMEALFGQGEFFDIKDDLNDQNGPIDVGQLKNQLKEDFAQDKVRKSFDHIELLAEIYGTGIGEITVGKEKKYYPATVPIDPIQSAYGVAEKDRICVKLVPVNPKNFLFDPNGTSIEDCMGAAVERYVSIHKIVKGIKDGKYMDVDIDTLYDTDELEPTQESTQFQDEKVLLMTYYGLVPREYLTSDEEYENVLGENESTEDYQDMVEAIVVIANKGMLLKAEENPYMMKDRPIIAFQDDTVPGRLLGRGTVEKSVNMQSGIDSSMRSHLDSLAITGAPMMGIDATRVPRGMKFEVIPGKSIFTNGNPAEILTPMKFGATDGMAMQTSKEFERMLLMATNTVDSNGQTTQVARDSQGIDMATATMIKKNKRALVNRQEDFVIPFVNKAAWRYMQFDPERYPAVDAKFIPTATLGIVAREYEQKQLAFLVQTLGKDSPLTPILMGSIVMNSSLQDREKIAEQLAKASQPDPQAAQAQMAGMQMEMADKQADIQKKQAETQQIVEETKIIPVVAQAKLVAALSNNLNEDNESKDFERRSKIAELMFKERSLDLQEQDIQSNERIAAAQMESKKAAEKYLSDVETKLQ